MKTCRIALIAVCLLMFAVPALATSTRVASLSWGSDYYEDVYNVVKWYGSLPSYGGTAQFELGWLHQSSYADYTRLSNRGALLYADLDGEGEYGTAGVAFFESDPTEQIRAMWGRRFGDVQAAVMYRFRHIRDDVNTDDPLFFSFMDADQTVGLGFRLSMSERWYLDFAGDITTTWRRWKSVTETYLPRTKDTDTWSLRLRSIHGISDQAALFAAATWSREAHPQYLSEERNLFDYTRDFWTTGLGVNYLPDGDTLGIFSCEFGDLDYAYLYPRAELRRWDDLRALYYDSWRFRLNMGLERRVLSWCTLRAGARHYMSFVDRSEYKSIVYEEAPLWVEHDAASGTSTDVDLGVGIHFGYFDADFLFTDDAPFNLGSLFTQADNRDGSTWYKITLQYVF